MLLLLLGSLACGMPSLVEGFQDKICNPSIGYCTKYFNETKLPNKFNEDSFSKVVSILMHYKDLAESECHPHVDLLICSTLFPACTPGYDITLPCNDFCEEVKDSCQPFIKKARISWPFYFDCLGLPRKRRNRFCINPKFKLSDLQKIRPPKPNKDNKVEPLPATEDVFTGVVNDEGLVLVTTPPSNRKDEKRYEACPGPILFSAHQQHTARIWIMAWSCIAISLSFIISFITIAYGKLEKPENIIVTLNFCLLFQAVGFLLSVVVPQPAFQCSVRDKPDDPIYLRTSNPTSTCLITFTAIYFTGIASNLWWVTLNLIWFLMLGLNWSDGSIFKVFRYLHLVIWGLAGGLTVTVLTLDAVEGDDLSGGCFAGGIDPQNLATYDITPNCVLLCIGGVVLFAGGCTMLRISRVDGYKHIAESSLKRLKRTAVFSLCFFLISVVKTLCQFYELMYRTRWYKSCDPNLELANSTDNSTLSNSGSGACGPDYRLFLLKYTAYLLIPILIAGYLRSAVSFLGIIKRLVPIAKGYSHNPGETKV